MAAVAEFPTKLASGKMKRASRRKIRPTPAHRPQTELPTKSGSSKPELLQAEEYLAAGIVRANSWLDLEYWIGRAERACQEGDLAFDQLEKLVQQAVEVSRGIPER